MKNETRLVMKMLLKRTVILVSLVVLSFTARAAFVAFEAESGTLGADFTNGTSGAVQFISISTDKINNGNPENSNRVATYTVNIPAAGKYYLYARVRVGPDTFNDDSMFIAKSAGLNSPTTDSDWATVNGLGGVGFSNATDVVTGGGTLGSGIWKWINLSQAAGQPRFTFSAGNQVFQIGARENGLDFDKFVFGTSGYTFTVSNLDNGTDGTPPPPPPPASSTIDSTKVYQTIEGLGGAIAFYNGWVTAHPYRLEIYTNAFAGLNLSMLRLGNWFRYQGSVNFDPDAPGFVTNANRVLGHSVPILMSSWSPPAFLKSNGQVGNGGTLLYTNGGFRYNEFAQYWQDSLLAYGSNGVSPTWISLQNEPDWEAGYDSCIFRPTEVYTNSTNYWAGYSNALSATFLRLTNLPSPPKLLGPENVGLNGNSAAVQNYAATMNSNHFYGVAHHLYGGSTDGSPDGYKAPLGVLTNIFPDKPRFMTEYGLSDMMDQANLIHNVLTVEQASGYNYWSLIWPFDGNGLVQIENPYNQSSWTNAPPGTATQSHGWWLSPAYWSMKHFSYFVQPGYRRVSAACTDTNVLTSAYLSPEGLRLVVVFVNRNLGSSTNTVSFGSFPYSVSSVYQTAGTNTFRSLGSAGSQLVLPGESLTTVVLDKSIVVAPATNPSPADGATGVALNSALSWTPGSNAVMHALYLGINSNAVAQATRFSQEYLGTMTTNGISRPLGAGVTYFWRVDEIAGVNTNTGAVWSFATVSPGASFVLKASDALVSSSFSAIGNWVTNETLNSAATSPVSTATYDTAVYTLRTPEGMFSATFGGAALTLSGGAPAATGSLLLKGPAESKVTVNNLILSGGVLGHGLSGTIYVAGNINVVSNSAVTGFGTAGRTIGITANISGGAALTNDCLVIYSGNNSGFSGQLIMRSGSSLQVSSPDNLGGPGAKLVFDGGAFLPLASLPINKPGGSVAINSGGGTWQIGPSVTITVSNPITGSGNLTCFAGGGLQLAGTNTATGNLVANGIKLTLLGDATFKNSQLIVSNGAVLDVASLTTPLTISNRLVTSLGGNLVAAVNKTGFTTLLTASNITYGGTLTLTNLGPALAYGDTIKLFSASNYSGAFSGIVPATPGTGLQWNTSGLSLDGTLFVTSTNPALITPPRITSFQLLGGSFALTGTNGNAPGTFFYTLASTNLALPLANWTIIATNQFGAGGGFTVTNNDALDKVWQFFCLRLP